MANIFDSIQSQNTREDYLTRYKRANNLLDNANEKEEQSALDVFIDAAQAGAAGTLGGQARLGAEYLPIGNETLSGFADSMDKIVQENAPKKELSGLDYVANAVGNAVGSGGATLLETGALMGLGSLAGLGGAATGALGGLASAGATGAKVAGAIQKMWNSPYGKFLIANVGSSPLEAGAEAGNLITEMRNEGYTDDEIKEAALKSAAYNTGWLTVANALEAGTVGKITGALGDTIAQPTAKDYLKRIAQTAGLSGVSEGTQEYGQNIIGDVAKNTPINWDEALEAAQMGAVGGAFLGGIGGGLGTYFNRNANQPEQMTEAQETDMQDEAQPQMQGLREMPIAEGIEDVGLQKTDKNLINAANMLNTWAYNNFGKDLIISGGARSEEYNREVNGSPTSYHLSGQALDVDASNFTEEERQQIEAKAREMGFNSNGENMYHDMGTGLHFHFVLPEGLQQSPVIESNLRDYYTDEISDTGEVVEQIGNIPAFKPKGFNVKSFATPEAEAQGYTETTNYDDQQAALIRSIAELQDYDTAQGTPQRRQFSYKAPKFERDRKVLSREQSALKEALSQQRKAIPQLNRAVDDLTIQSILEAGKDEAKQQRLVQDRVNKNATDLLIQNAIENQTDLQRRRNTALNNAIDRLNAQATIEANKEQAAIQAQQAARQAELDRQWYAMETARNNRITPVADDTVPDISRVIPRQTPMQLVSANTPEQSYNQLLAQIDALQTRENAAMANEPIGYDQNYDKSFDIWGDPEKLRKIRNIVNSRKQLKEREKLNRKLNKLAKNKVSEQAVKEGEKNGQSSQNQLQNQQPQQSKENQSQTSDEETLRQIINAADEAREGAQQEKTPQRIESITEEQKTAETEKQADATSAELLKEAEQYVKEAYPNDVVKGIKLELKAAQDGLEQMLQPVLDELKAGMGQGVSLVPNEDPEKPERLIRVSNNAKWYSDFYKQNKRKPHKRELLDIAIEVYTGKDSHGLSNWQDIGTEEAQQFFKENSENVAYYENLIEAYETLLDKYSAMAQKTKKAVKKPQKSNDVLKEKQAIFSDSKTAEDNLAKLLGLKKKKQEPKKAFNVIDDSDAALEEALKELKSEVNKLSANPVFNPALHKAAFKVGMIYLQRGTNKFADWSKQMIEAVGEKIRPWLGSIWKSIQTYPKNEKLDPETMSTAVDFVGAKYNDGLRTADDIYNYMVENYGEEQAKPFKGLIESAFAGIDELYNPTIDVNAEGVEEDVIPDSTKRIEEDNRGTTGNAIRNVAERQGSATSDGTAVQQTREEENQPSSNTNLSGSRPAAGRKTDVGESKAEVPRVSALDTGSNELSTSVVDSYTRKPDVDAAAIKNVAETSDARRTDETVKNTAIKAVKQVNKSKGTRLQQVTEEMPFLTEGQAQDVVFAENAFYDNDKLGVLFTNGTGTGKTFSGLGIIKRFTDEGKNNVLIVAPSNKINQQWVIAAKDFFELKVTQLENIKDAGTGVVITTYANMQNNDALVQRNWNLIVADEAHNLMNNEQGAETGVLKKLRALTYHHSGLTHRAMILNETPEIKDVKKQLNKLQQEADALQKEKKSVPQDLQQQISQLRSEQQKLYKDIYPAIDRDIEKWSNMDRSEKPKVVFLSATPFAYTKDIDYAEGYLFDYPQADGTGYNSGNGQQQFMMQHFGYTMRYNKLTRPDAKVDNRVMEVQFHEWLRKNDVLSGRQLAIDKDYNRGFLLVDQGIGSKIDEGFEWLRENHTRYSLLSDFLSKQFDGRSRNYLIESIKAREVIPIIKEYLKQGKKVVLFHDTKKLRVLKHPFVIGEGTIKGFTDRGEIAQLHSEWEKFSQERPDLVKLNLQDLESPIAILQKAFGDDLLLFNGDIPTKQRNENVDMFNKDDSGKNLIMVQADAGNAGISLHDTTGKHQRVLINIGIPKRPSYAIQIEGRIYRQGNKSNAILRYLSTGTNIEKYLFASTIASRASTAENLAMGNQARALRDSFISSFEETLDGTWEQRKPGAENEDVGGKEADMASAAIMSDFDRAKSLYYAQAKKTSKNKAQEGIDYFPTPEPVGYKMVEWADLLDGEKALEPSAGHGAISRFFSPNTENVIIEPSVKLAPLAQLNTDNAKLIQGYFEEYNIVNKFDAVVMNPPYGTASKTAMEHLEKAFKHLRNNGRVLAIVPNGPSMQKRFDKWYESEDAKNAYLVGEVLLPGAAFKRAGTSVNTKILIIDKHVTKEPLDIYTKTLDFSRLETPEELFDAIENISMPPRIRETLDVEIQPQATSNANIEDVNTQDYMNDDVFIHTKTQETLYRSTPINRVDKKDFAYLKNIAKENNGYYSPYAKGFLFSDENDRNSFSSLAAQHLNPENQIKYSAAASPENQRAYDQVLDEVQSALPSANIEQQGNNLIATMPNGAKIAINIKDRIIVNAKEQASARKAHGLKDKKAIIIEGAWQNITAGDVDGVLSVSQEGRIGTAYHEVMHAAMDLALTERERTALYNHYAKAKGDIDEAIAEGYKEWITARQNKRGTTFGKLFQKMQDMWYKLKSIFLGIDNAHDVMRKIETGEVWSNQTSRESTVRYSARSAETSTQKAAKAFTNTERKGTIETVKDWIADKRKNLYRDWIDKNDSLHELDQALEMGLGRKLQNGESIYNKVQTLPANAAGTANALIEGNTNSINAINKRLQNKKLKHNVTLAMVLDKINRQKMDKAYPSYLKENGFNNWVDAFGTYLGCIRLNEMSTLRKEEYNAEVKEWEKAGRKGRKPEMQEYKLPGGLTETDLQNVIKTAPAAFKQAADMYWKFNDNVLTIMEDAGLISSDTHNVLNTKYKYYCPLMRDFSDTAAADNFINGLSAGGRGIGNVSSPLKRISIEGSERNVINPLESTIKAVAVIANRAERNKVGQMAVDLAQQGLLNSVIEEVPGTVADPKNCIFTVMHDGKKTAYRTTQELYGPIVGYNLPAAGFVLGIAKNAARLLRAGATTSPSFILRNLIRDTIFAGISSQNGFIPVVDTAKGAYALLKNAERTAEFNAAGVTKFNFYNSAETITKSLDEMAGGKDWRDYGIADIWRAIMKYPAMLSEFIESSTRMGEFIKARGKGKTIDEAARAARELTLDFSRSGVTGEKVNQFIPFFNAVIQGSDKMVRLLKNDTLNTVTALAKYIILPSVVLWILNKDEDWYMEIDPAVKATNWILPGNVRIPKPQEAGILFGSGIEAMLDEATNKDPEALNNWAKTFLNNVGPSILPALLLPLIEWQANYSFFRGEKLVSGRLEDLPDELQYYPGTSELSKAFGAAAKLSPVKIDNMIRGYTGTMGMFVWQLSDKFVAEKQNMPAKKVTEIPFLRDFFNTTNIQNRSVDEFYDMLEKANKQHAGYGKKGKPSAAVKGVRAAGKLISDAQKDIRAITTNPRMTPELKRAKIDKKKEYIKKVAQLANKRYKKYFK